MEQNSNCDPDDYDPGITSEFMERMGAIKNKDDLEKLLDFISSNISKEEAPDVLAISLFDSMANVAGSLEDETMYERLRTDPSALWNIIGQVIVIGYLRETR